MSRRVDSYFAYDGSYTDGPFQNPLRYRRDNVNANFTKTLGADEKLGFRFLFGRNNFYSSGQIPLDLVAAGLLDRFGYIDPTDGGRVVLGTLSAYYSKTFHDGGTLRADGFLSRSLFDLYSNFTFYLNDPVNGDAIQQHDSRLQQGANAQYTRPHKLCGSRRPCWLAEPIITTTKSTSVSTRATDGRPPVSPRAPTRTSPTPRAMCRRT